MLAIIILAIIQGIAEFLPISSSFHLIIFRDVFFLGKDVITENIELSFDIALHFGTSLAIFIYFVKDFWEMCVNGFSNGIKDNGGKMMWYVIVATIPAAIVGVLFEDVIDDVIRTKYFLITLAFVVMGVLIYWLDTSMNQKKSLKTMNYTDAIIIGFSQIFALIPGFSRSGTTIAVARLLKFNREDAAKFSFYLAEPVIIGAVIIQLFKTDMSIVIDNISVFVVGIIVSFVTGVLCIKLLLKYLRNNDFKIFMWYRLTLGAIVLLYLFF